MILVPLDTLKVSFGFRSPPSQKLTSLSATDDHADAGSEWSADLERSHQGLRDWNVVVWSLGDGSRFLRGQLPLVSSLVSRSLTLADPYPPPSKVCYIQLPLVHPPTTQHSTREACSASLHRLRCFGRLGHHLQLPSRGQDISPSEPDAHQLQ